MPSTCNVVGDPEKGPIESTIDEARQNTNRAFTLLDQIESRLNRTLCGAVPELAQSKHPPRETAHCEAHDQALSLASRTYDLCVALESLRDRIVT